MKLTQKKYHELERRLCKLLEVVRPSLTEGEQHAIEHYIEHAELEMAVECLGLYLIKFKVPLPDDTTRKLLDLSVELGLDKESVFDDEFWDHFRAYLSKH